MDTPPLSHISPHWSPQMHLIYNLIFHPECLSQTPSPITNSISGFLLIWTASRCYWLVTPSCFVTPS